MGSPCPGTTRDRSQFPRSRLHVEVTSFAAYFAVYQRSARITSKNERAQSYLPSFTALPKRASD